MCSALPLKPTLTNPDNHLNEGESEIEMYTSRKNNYSHNRLEVPSKLDFR